MYAQRMIFRQAPRLTGPVSRLHGKTFNALKCSQYSSAATASSSSNKGKRGLSWSTQSTDAITPFTGSGSKVTWLHNWSTRPHLAGLGKEIEWVPLQWNLEGIKDLAKLVNKPPSPSDGDASASSSLPSASAVLAFSEPERPDASNIKVKEGVKAWMEYIEPLRKDGKVKAGSPGISSDETGIAWLQDFTAQIRDQGGDVDFWALHWYGPNDLGLLYNYLWGTHSRLGNNKPVWLTEYACSTFDANNPIEKAAVENFARESITYFDTLDWIERYAWNGPASDPGALGKYSALLDSKGELTDLGKIYRDA